jgi:hypothetical protein
MTQTEVPTVRILAYIHRLFRPNAIGAPYGTPNEFQGFFLDVTIEVETGKGDGGALLQYYGDGVPYRTFEEAQKQVFRESGVVIEPLPEESWAKIPEAGSFFQCVGVFVREFKSTNKPQADIERESPMSKHNIEERMRLMRESQILEVDSDSASTQRPN